MIKILRFSPGRTRKSEFKALYNAMVEIAETYNPEELHFSESLNKMKEALPQVDNLIVPERKSPLTDKLQESRKKRNDYVSSIMMQLKANLKTDDTANAEAAKRLLSIANRILSNFSRKNIRTQLSLADQFINEVEENATLKQSLASVGIEASFNKLKTVQNTVNTTYNNRRITKLVRKKTEYSTNKHDLYRLMVNLFSTIEGVALAYPALDYTPLITELNDEIISQRAESAARSTRAAKLNTLTSAEDIKVS